MEVLGITIFILFIATAGIAYALISEQHDHERFMKDPEAYYKNEEVKRLGIFALAPELTKNVSITTTYEEYD